MFEIGRELRRFFSPSAPRDGLSLGDPALLELLDLKLLQAEAKSADVAAGRIGERDRPRRLLEAGAVWRELARRTGDPAALRKAASCAEAAGEALRNHGRANDLAQAVCEQAASALAGAALFGEDGLNVAADFLLGQAPASAASAAGPLRAELAARRSLAEGDLIAVRAAVAGFDRVLAGYRAKRPPEVLAAARTRTDRADYLITCGNRLHEPDLIRQALDDLDAAKAALDEAFHPISLARVCELRGLGLVRLGELTADLSPVLEGVDQIASALDLITLDHSPLDWARMHHVLGLTLMTLGQMGDNASAFDRALDALTQALRVMQTAPATALRTMVAQDRAACLVRRAELRGDIFALDEAEAALRGELARVSGSLDPVAWAVLQMNLAQVYVAQAAARGRDRGERVRAYEALSAAFEVFAEKGLRSLTAAAEDGLRRLRQTAGQV